MKVWQGSILDIIEPASILVSSKNYSSGEMTILLPLRVFNRVFEKLNNLVKTSAKAANKENIYL